MPEIKVVYWKVQDPTKLGMRTAALQYTKMNQAHVNGIIMINLQPGAILTQAHINGINIINLQPGAVLKQRNWRTTV